MRQRLSDYDQSTVYDARVLDSEPITDAGAEAEIRHIILEINDPGFSFTEGQSIGVITPGPKEFGGRNHFRLYSIASSRLGEDGDPARFAIAVRRCHYIDDFSGESVKGVASNYLCDRQPGDTIRVTGPYGGAFALPADPNINLLMIGVGTGIAPFRAFMKRIYKEKGGRWNGKIRLFYGAKRGSELAYMNDVKNDFTNYYDEDTFKAFEALSPRPALDAPIALEQTLEAHEEEIWQMVQDPLTNVYVAGLETARDAMDKAMAKWAGSDEIWKNLKATLIANGRWAELIY